MSRPLSIARITPTTDVLIVGASVRAAAYSALRAGLEPRGVDLFCDADLINRCNCRRLPNSQYPDGLVDFLQNGCPSPWMYTGALENRPSLIRKMVRLQPLWGNCAQVLTRVRSPFAVEAWLRDRGLPCPRHRRSTHESLDGRWLIKPMASAGGRGIDWWSSSTTTLSGDKVYLQEFIDGESCAAVYVGDGGRATLLGVTQQLTGEPWLNAAAFHYCGSVGPMLLKTATQQAFERLGLALVQGFRLRGLFGVDCVLAGGVPYPVEINPRYTASVEVLEYATGVAALALHRDAFGDQSEAACGGRTRQLHESPTMCVGKAILFARETVAFPNNGPWCEALDPAFHVNTLPPFADIPHAGQKISARQPILTMFARATSMAACVDQLQRIAQDLDRWLTRR
jgi:predicted ATP-grasp superfamily ATP-dependent carboligase